MVHDEEKKYRRRQEQRFPQHFCELPYSPDRVYPMLDPINPKAAMRLKLWVLHMLSAWREHPYMPLIRPSNYTIEMEQKVHIRSEYWWLIHPLSRFWMSWTLFVTLTNISVLLIVPVYQAFFHTRILLRGGNATGQLPYVWWLDDDDPVIRAEFQNQDDIKVNYERTIGFCETIFIIHIIFKFVTGRTDFQENNVVMHHPTIMKRYTLTWFFPDLVAAMPLEGFNRVVGLFNQEDMVDYMNPWRRVVLYVYTVVYSMRFIRLYDIFQTIRVWCRFCNLSCVYVYFLFYAIFFLLFIQWSAFYLVRLPFLVEGPYLFSPRSKTWMADPVNQYLILNRSYPITKQYFSALHRVFEASGSMSPFSSTWSLSHEDVAVMLLVMWISHIFKLVLFALIMRYIEVSQKPIIRLHKILSEVEAFGRERSLPLVTRQRTKVYYKHRFQLYYYNVRSILNSFTTNLRKAVNQHECRRVVQNSPLFRGLPKAVLHKISAHLDEDLYLPHDVVYSSGSDASYLYFLSIGTVAIYLRTGEEVGHLEDGDYFGIMGVMLPEYNRTHIETIVALEMCEVFKLPRRHLDTVMNRMPRLYARLRSAAFTRSMDMSPARMSIGGGRGLGERRPPMVPMPLMESASENEEDERQESTSSLDSDVLRELEAFLV